MDRQLNLNRAETFSFVNPWIRYFLFFFSFLFWVSRVCKVRRFPGGFHPVKKQGSHHEDMQFLVTRREAPHKHGASSPPWVYFWFGPVLYIYIHIFGGARYSHSTAASGWLCIQTVLTQATPHTPANLVVSHDLHFFFLPPNCF